MLLIVLELREAEIIQEEEDLSSITLEPGEPDITQEREEEGLITQTEISGVISEGGELSDIIRYGELVSTTIERRGPQIIPEEERGGLTIEILGTTQEET